MHGWLPDDHLAWFIQDAVDSLDIDALSDRYRMCGKGELPYDPRMLVGVMIYACCTGTFSSRKIAAQLEDSVAFRVLLERSGFAVAESGFDGHPRGLADRRAVFCCERR